MPRFLHDSHLAFLSLFPVLVRALQGQLSSRLRAVGAALLVLVMLRSGADSRLEAEGDVSAYLAGRVNLPLERESNNLLTGETGVLRIACCTFLFWGCKAISKVSVSKALLTNMCAC